MVQLAFLLLVCVYTRGPICNTHSYLAAPATPFSPLQLFSSFSFLPPYAFPSLLASCSYCRPSDLGHSTHLDHYSQQLSSFGILPSFTTLLLFFLMYLPIFPTNVTFKIPTPSKLIFQANKGISVPYITPHPSASHSLNCPIHFLICGPRYLSLVFRITFV